MSELDNLGDKIIFLENIRSLHNVGSIFRTTDGADWSGIVLGGYTGAPPDRRIEKVSLGAEKHLPWMQAENPAEILKKFKNEGFRIIGLEQTSKSSDIFSAKFEDGDYQKVILILGNEVEGVSEEVLDLCDMHLELKMSGEKSSLNVSVAGGIAMYELNRAIGGN